MTEDILKQAMKLARDVDALKNNIKQYETFIDALEKAPDCSWSGLGFFKFNNSPTRIQIDDSKEDRAWIKEYLEEKIRKYKALLAEREKDFRKL